MSYTLSRKSLILDLYGAFTLAKKHKSNRIYVKVFEEHLQSNIERLADELLERTYVAEPSSCFIVERPKKREVFAAQFRDRIIHHLYYNYTHELFERTFIHDTYSCIEGRGTHFGIARLAKHIRQESRNYTKKCYVLKMDIRGYFMHIDRLKLLDIALNTLSKMRYKKTSMHGTQTWDDVIDFDFVMWLTREIVLLCPKKNCHIVGNIKEWDGLDHSKSLFYTPENCGIPIGNLTSQLFSNVYLNVYDQFVKRVLKCKHYGRYVDDSYIISCDKRFLMSLVPKIRSFLHETLGLDMHMGKLQVRNAHYGIDFLGGFVKPYRNYVSNETLRRTRVNIACLNFSDKGSIYRSVNSFLGLLSHYKSYNIRRDLFFNSKFLSVGSFNSDMTKMNKF